MDYFDKNHCPISTYYYNTLRCNWNKLSFEENKNLFLCLYTYEGTYIKLELF